jgi:hypothetical protein
MDGIFYGVSVCLLHAVYGAANQVTLALDALVSMLSSREALPRPSLFTGELATKGCENSLRSNCTHLHVHFTFDEGCGDPGHPAQLFHLAELS